MIIDDYVDSDSEGEDVIDIELKVIVHSASPFTRPPHSMIDGRTLVEVRQKALSYYMQSGLKTNVLSYILSIADSDLRIGEELLGWEEAGVLRLHVDRIYIADCSE